MKEFQISRRAMMKAILLGSAAPWIVSFAQGKGGT